MVPLGRLGGGVGWCELDEKCAIPAEETAALTRPKLRAGYGFEPEDAARFCRALN
jgi:hypothetical protein